MATAQLAPPPNALRRKFIKHWQSATDSNNISPHGFRRFKTTHLLNLRFLEDEIAEADHAIYQAGLSLDLESPSSDRLGLRCAKRDENSPALSEIITHAMVQKLRSLLKEYDDALLAFNRVMNMETISLLDDPKQSSLRTDLTWYEIYNTRLLRTDCDIRSRTDPFQRRLHKYLRSFRYWRLSRNPQDTTEARGPTQAHLKWSYQNTVLIADMVGRVVAVIVTAAFFVIPLAVLPHKSMRTQVGTASMLIVAFSLTVTLMLKASNLEMIVVTAAYAAVLTTFVANMSVSEP
ncbi:hypothetical protein F4803DRAFT_79964 [Xylaria telfairii]|nr:hypothetical protein F4803DRAFT_79964 [Xylaria telfairii]